MAAAGAPPAGYTGERQQSMIDIAAQRFVKLHVRVAGTRKLLQDAGDRVPTRIIVRVGEDHLDAFIGQSGEGLKRRTKLWGRLLELGRHRMLSEDDNRLSNIELQALG